MTEEKSAAELLAEKAREEVQEQLPPGVFVEGELEKKEEQTYDQCIEIMREQGVQDGKELKILPGYFLDLVPVLCVGTGFLVPIQNKFNIIDSVTVYVCLAPDVFEAHSYIRTDALILTNKKLRGFLGYPEVAVTKSKTAYKRAAKFQASIASINSEGILFNPTATQALLSELSKRKTPFMLHGLLKFLEENSQGPNILLSAAHAPEGSDEQSANTPNVEQECGDDSDGDRESEGRIFVP